MLFSSREKDVVVALLTVFTQQNQNILIGTLTAGAADTTPSGPCQSSFLMFSTVFLVDVFLHPIGTKKDLYQPH